MLFRLPETTNRRRVGLRPTKQIADLHKNKPFSGSLKIDFNRMIFLVGRRPTLQRYRNPHRVFQFTLSCKTTPQAT